MHEREVGLARGAKRLLGLEDDEDSDDGNLPGRPVVVAANFFDILSINGQPFNKDALYTIVTDGRLLLGDDNWRVLRFAANRTYPEPGVPIWEQQDLRAV